MYKPEIISNAEYHGRKTHLSSTNIRTFKKNRKQFEYSLSHDLVKQTKAMVDGSAIHAFLLERAVFDSDFAIKPFPAYSASKAGLHGLTLWLSSYWSSYNSTVNTLSPAGVFNNQPEALVNKLSSLNILNRMANSSEVSAKLCFLSSPDSDFMTGQNIFVDGGYTAW